MMASSPIWSNRISQGIQLGFITDVERSPANTVGSAIHLAVKQLENSSNTFGRTLNAIAFLKLLVQRSYNERY